MVKKFFGVLSSVLVLSLLVCGAAFAQDVPVPDGFTRDEALSASALDMAKQQFETLKLQLQGMLPSLPPDQQAMVTQAIAVVDDKLARLERIDVYFADEAAPGAAYDALYAFYQDKLNNIQNVGNDDLQFAVTQTPPGMVPPQTMESLMALIGEGKVRAATGGAGKSRVSMLTVYVNPTTFEVLEGTTLVIATDK